MASILLVGDDLASRARLDCTLTDNSHTVHIMGTAVQPPPSAADRQPDIIILDLGMPDVEGETAIRMFRDFTNVPLIISTERDDETSMVRLLNLGADDYLVKPFSDSHLIARIDALLRRSTTVRVSMDVVNVGDLRIDFRARTARLGGAILELTRREFDLLAFLARRSGSVVTRRELVKEVWQRPYDSNDQTLNVHLSRLRRKLGETGAAPRYLHTQRGVGLQLLAPAPTAFGSAAECLPPPRRAEHGVLGSDSVSLAPSEGVNGHRSATYGPDRRSARAGRATLTRQWPDFSRNDAMARRATP